MVSPTTATSEAARGPYYTRTSVWLTEGGRMACLGLTFPLCASVSRVLNRG